MARKKYADITTVKSGKKKGEFRFNLIASNGKVVGGSGTESYVEKSKCKQTIKRLYKDFEIRDLTVSQKPAPKSTGGKTVKKPSGKGKLKQKALSKKVKTVAIGKPVAKKAAAKAARKVRVKHAVAVTKKVAAKRKEKAIKTAEKKIAKDMGATSVKITVSGKSRTGRIKSKPRTKKVKPVEETNSIDEMQDNVSKGTNMGDTEQDMQVTTAIGEPDKKPDVKVTGQLIPGKLPGSIK